MGLEEINLIRCTTLAYVGDSVFSLFVRSALSRDLTLSTHKLMEKGSHIVSAVVQARIYDALYPKLFDDEKALTERCKNAHLSNKAKNATMLEYRKATALEGLLGALYLIGRTERLNELLNLSLEIANE